MPDYPPGLFVGTAEYYSRYRIPYPDNLLEDLRLRARLSGMGRLLDIACGTGEVGLALHSRFGEVWGVDQEPEMIAEARRKSVLQGAASTRWTVGRAEDLEAPDRCFELVSIGMAFHRLNQPLIANRVLRWLERDRCIALLGSNSVWTGKEEWQRRAVEVIRKWSPPKTQGSTGAEPPPRHERVLEAAGFEDVAVFAFPTQHVWTLDDFVGYLYSTSIASKPALGESVERFEEDMRTTLLDFDPRGEYAEVMDFYYVLGRAP